MICIDLKCFSKNYAARFLFFFSNASPAFNCSVPEYNVRNSPVLVIVIVLSNRESFMYCPNCGSDNPPDGKFCRHCGIGLAAVSAALLQKPGDTTAPTSKLAELLKGYNSGQHKMTFGGGSIPLGAVAPASPLVT